jgi:hypothetical protein
MAASIEDREGTPRRVVRDRSPYLRAKFLARIAWAVFSFALAFDLSTLFILRVIQPDSGSLLIHVPPYLATFGAGARFRSPILAIAF